MTKYSVAALTDYDISEDGRTVVLNFKESDADTPISLSFVALKLEAMFFEIGCAVTKARQLSELGKQNVVSYLRPLHSRADLIADGQTVVISFRQQNGIELHFGLEPNHAEALARQILDASERGKFAKPETKN